MILEARELKKDYGRRRIVRGVSISVKKGEVVGLLGPNGAGKTTIFYMVVGLTRAGGGEIMLGGERITDLPIHLRARRGIGYLPQEPSIFRKLTVEENILAIMEASDIPYIERNERLHSLLKELDISHLAKNRAYTLSGGERRRVEITRSLIRSPNFLLLDEPFAGIDPISVSEIQRIISQLKDRGIGILITDHNVRETLEITDRAYIINEGEILESGTPDYIAKSQKARAIYLGEKFRFNN